MADTKISAMTAASALGGTETLPGVQTAANVGITATQIQTFCATAATFVPSGNVLSIRNSTTAQQQKIYATYTDASNGAWGEIDLNTANTLIFGSNGNGTGASTISKFRLNILGVNKLDYGVSTAGKWTVGSDTIIKGSTTDSTAYALSVKDSANLSLFDIRNDAVIDASNVSIFTCQTLKATTEFRVNAGTRFRCTVDGNLTFYDTAGTAFGIIQIGGTTAAFPAIKRSGAALAFRVADDTADAAISAAAGTFSGAVQGAATTKAGVFTTADVPAGSWIVGRDTTNLTTKLYYNNAGTLMSVALA